jgi:hypothetical protein
MEQDRNRRARPELKALVAEASRALALLDADRLEDMALSCRALGASPDPAAVEQTAALRREAHAAKGDLAVFGRVLEATYANLNVMRRLRELREGRQGYGPQAVDGPKAMESGHGND